MSASSYNLWARQTVFLMALFNIDMNVPNVCIICAVKKRELREERSWILGERVKSHAIYTNNNDLSYD